VRRNDTSCPDKESDLRRDRHFFKKYYRKPLSTKKAKNLFLVYDLSISSFLPRYIYMAFPEWRLLCLQLGDKHH